MSEPWYDPNLWGWLPGTAVGVAGGLWGSLVGIFGSRGKGLSVIWASYWLFLMVGAAFVIVGIVAATGGQPYGVWYGLLFPGVLIFLVVGPLGIVVRKSQRLADQRKMQAQEFQ